MEEKEQEVSAGYLKRFNEGYLLAEHEPELAETISNALGSSDQATGFKAGRNQFMQERSKDRLPGWLNRDFSKENGKAESRNKGDLDLDMDKE